MATTVSSVTNHFPEPQDGFSTTLSSTISSGATTVPLTSTGSYSNGDVVVLIVDPADATKKQAFTGVVDTSGVQITGVKWTSGTDQSHTSGATVVDYVAATHIQMMTKGFLVEHSQDGTHAETITTDNINENTTAHGVTIDGLNIKDGMLNGSNAVTTTSLQNDSVTDAKLIYGKVRSRQGGSATNWSTAGTTTYDYSGTDTFIQVGTKALSAQTTSITFPTAFNQIPIVIASPTGSSGLFSTGWYVVSVSTTGFDFVAQDWTRATPLMWIAIGE